MSSRDVKSKQISEIYCGTNYKWLLDFSSALLFVCPLPRSQGIRPPKVNPVAQPIVILSASAKFAAAKNTLSDLGITAMVAENK